MEQIHHGGATWQTRGEARTIWVTWLARILSGDKVCEWAVWFRSRHEPGSWRRAGTGAGASWHLRHTALLTQTASRWRGMAENLLVEDQNYFQLQGKSAVLAGKPDLVAVNGSTGTVLDVKTGRPSPAHEVQVQLYMYALRTQYPGRVFDGLLVYPDREIELPADAVDQEFIETMALTIQRLTGWLQPPRMPSAAECHYCDITLEDCPERIDEAAAVLETDEF